MLRFLNINTGNYIKAVKQENSIKVHLKLQVNKRWVHYYFKTVLEAYLGPWQISMMELHTKIIQSFKWDKLFKNGPNEICGRQPLKNLKWFELFIWSQSTFTCWKLTIEA